MLELFLPIIALLAAGWLWHSMLGAKEIARAHAQRICAQAQLQLLDETVALKRMRPQRSADAGLQWWRDYGFEVSSNGSDRHRASVQTVGRAMLSCRLPNLMPPAIERRPEALP